MPPNKFRAGFVATSEDGAELRMSASKNRWKLKYRPGEGALDIAKRHTDFVEPRAPILLAEGSQTGDVLITYPLNTTATSPSFLAPKYPRIRTITFEGFGLFDADTIDRLNVSDADEDEDLREILQGLPSGFVKDPYFGLGLNYDLRYLIHAIEEIDGITDLHLRRGRRKGPPVIDGGSYKIAASAFDAARKGVNRIHDKALSIATSEKYAFVNNHLLTSVNPKKFPEKHRQYRKDAIREAIGESLSRKVLLSPADRTAVIAATTATARTAQRHEPEALLELTREIELVTLEALIERLKKMISKKLKEMDWQVFLTENPFVLKLAFGLPIVMIGGQITVGGQKFDGQGEKISDFAVKAAASGNLALVEIKTPDTAVVESRPYRGDLHAPGRELCGAVNQVLDQRYKLQKSITVLKDNSGVWDVESYAVQGLVIVGRTPSSTAELKSLELYRNALKSVLIITFDELLMKLEHLLLVLQPPELSVTVPAT